ncbi:MAG: twitching motility protein PilT [Candidatus Fluviicola riflensis]|nr:MAG: PIN domain nuclease [Candidatus Fluviicola riflensis]OGS79760.1 MAG: twitching motility protein PilT [Candidatus Fluviicola riflensis]OGS87193.1 MAG: twitching motility protein PilT [Fluviicola sp. RIFCSPHIGHO2_01_FULL_43_53]OGS89981.1 MAG: twitching motility protein PilT [Fluviicola sp. RIFCSPHIGHO2_12_FULL_43_24]
MENVFVDTNVIIDLLGKREPFYKDAQDLFTLSDKNEIQLCISSLSFANAYYSIVKHHKEVNAKKYMAKFKVLVTVLPLEDKAIELALASEFEDFEDGLQYFVAMNNEADIIITRNKKDFKSSKIPVLTAGEYLKK